MTLNDVKVENLHISESFNNFKANNNHLWNSTGEKSKHLRENEEPLELLATRKPQYLLVEPCILALTRV